MPSEFKQCKVLLVDDEPAWLRAMDLALVRTFGTDNRICSDSREVSDLLAREQMDLVLLDITMPYLSGQDLLQKIKQESPHMPVIMTTGLLQVELAVECMRQGAFDYFVKTTEVERIMNGIRRALELSSLRQENLRLRDHFLQNELENPEAFTDFISDNPKIRSICQYIEAIAKSSEPVLILGESGVGKELVAKAVHQAGHASGPWVAVNVAGLDDNVFSDTLFGHVKGAYTGADQARPGVVEEAAGGVLFLDEIGDLSPASQVKLLRLLQEGDYYPLGSDVPKHHNTRFVFATNRDLEALQQSGDFRSDLFYRLNSYRVALPPLRERREDIPLLMDRFITAAAESLKKEKPSVPRQLVPLLQSYHFPGNIRELRALVFEAVSLHRKGVLSLKSFHSVIGEQPTAGGFVNSAEIDPVSSVVYPEQLPTLKESADLLVDEAMRRANHNQTQAARLLGISRPALSKRLKNRS